VGHLIKKKGKYNDEYEEMKDGSKVPKMYGKFHLGSQYDINTWLSN
jgi:hypothetical protein